MCLFALSLGEVGSPRAARLGHDPGAYFRARLEHVPAFGNHGSRGRDPSRASARYVPGVAEGLGEAEGTASGLAFVSGVAELSGLAFVSGVAELSGLAFTSRQASLNSPDSLSPQASPSSPDLETELLKAV